MDRQIAQLLAQAGHSAPSADNSQPISFVWDGDSLQVRYDAPRVAGRTFAPDSPATLLSAGAALENLCQIDRHYKLDMAVALPTVSSPAGSPYATARVARSVTESTPKQALPLFNRHTNRSPMTGGRIFRAKSGARSTCWAKMQHGCSSSRHARGLLPLPNWPDGRQKYASRHGTFRNYWPTACVTLPTRWIPVTVWMCAPCTCPRGALCSCA